MSEASAIDPVTCNVPPSITASEVLVLFPDSNNVPFPVLKYRTC